MPVVPSHLQGPCVPVAAWRAQRHAASQCFPARTALRLQAGGGSKLLASAPAPQLSSSSNVGACSTVLTRLRASGTGAAERSVGGQLGAPSRGRAERNVPPGCTAQERRNQSCARELWRPPVPPLSKALPHGAILTAVKACLSIWAQSVAAGACIAVSRLLVVLLRAIVMYKCLGGKHSFDWPRGGENQPSANTYPTQ